AQDPLTELETSMEQLADAVERDMLGMNTAALLLSQTLKGLGYEFKTQQLSSPSDINRSLQSQVIDSQSKTKVEEETLKVAQNILNAILDGRVNELDKLLDEIRARA